MQVEIYSDVACPWCYVGQQRFEKALAAFAGREQVSVHYRPFQLDPSLPGEPEAAEPGNTYLTRRFGPRIQQMQAHLAEVAKAEGIDFQPEKVLMINTLAAHRLLWLAEREGGPAVQVRLSKALFKAHFTDGLNVAEPETLVALAQQAGLDPERVRRALAEGEGRAEVQSEIAHARELGVTAVPTFVFEGRWGVSGAQEVATFQQLLEQVARESAPEGSEAPGCADGACEI